jgi:hypothetical protein
VNTLRTVTGLILALCFFVALAWFLLQVALLPEGHTWSHDAYLSVMLTALGVMVATFGIMVGLAAIWGYAGLRDSLREMAVKQVDQAMAEGLKKYPDASDILSVLKRLQDHADLLDQMRNQAVTERPEAKTVETASKASVQEEVAGAPATPLDSVEQQTTPIEKYPGEENGHARSDSDDGPRTK